MNEGLGFRGPGSVRVLRSESKVNLSLGFRVKYLYLANGMVCNLWIANHPPESSTSDAKSNTRYV